MTEEWKLYVWNDPYDVSYGSSMVVAVARSEQEARATALAGKAFTFGEYDKPTPNVVLGPPLRVTAVPCAEWHEWSE